MFEKRKSEINRRKAEIRELLEKGVDADGNAINIDNITEELRQLNAELSDLDRRATALGEACETSSSIPNPFVEQRNEGHEVESSEPRAVLATPEYKSAFAKTLLNRSLTEKESRALDTALTTTATTFVAPSGSADGVNNGGLFIPTDMNLSLLEHIGLVSPIFRDVSKTAVPGLTKFPYRSTITKPKNVKENAKTPETSIEWTDLTLSISEIAATIPVSWRLEAMAVKEFISYLMGELTEQMEDKSVTETIYGTGSTDDQLSGISKDAVKYEYEGTALDAIGVALGKFKSKKHLVGAKIYVSNSIINDISFTKDANGNYIYTPINGAGIKSIATYPVEADPYLNDGDFIIGNLSRYYKMNEHERISITRDVSGAKRRNDYTAYGIWSGALQPETVVYGVKKAK